MTQGLADKAKALHIRGQGCWICMSVFKNVYLKNFCKHVRNVSGLVLI